MAGPRRDDEDEEMETPEPEEAAPSTMQLFEQLFTRMDRLERAVRIGDLGSERRSERGEPDQQPPATTSTT